MSTRFLSCRQHFDSTTTRNPAHSPGLNLSGPPLSRSRTVTRYGAQRGCGPANRGVSGVGRLFWPEAADSKCTAAAGADHRRSTA